MPVACSTSALTGQEGSIYFKPAGTQFCLLAADFPAGTAITVPTSNDFRVGDPVEFTPENGATLDTKTVAGTTYYVLTVTATAISISATNGGAAITLDGDAVTDGSSHIKISYAEFQAVCQVREFSFDLTREQLDVTTLPCGVGTSAGAKYASFKKFQPGYASGTGTMTVYFTDDQTALANRLLGNVLLKSQEGAYVKLYVNTVSDGQTPAAPDDAESLYIESGISIEGMSLSVNPDDATTGDLTYSILNPTVFLGTTLT